MSTKGITILWFALAAGLVFVTVTYNLPKIENGIREKTLAELENYGATNPKSFSVSGRDVKIELEGTFDSAALTSTLKKNVPLRSLTIIENQPNIENPTSTSNANEIAAKSIIYHFQDNELKISGETQNKETAEIFLKLAESTNRELSEEITTNSESLNTVESVNEEALRELLINISNTNEDVRIIVDNGNTTITGPVSGSGSSLAVREAASKARTTGLPVVIAVTQQPEIAEPSNEISPTEKKLDSRELQTALETNVNLDSIQFEPGSAKLTLKATVELNKVSEVLKGNEPYTIVVTAHTDSQGEANDNQKLSEDRAKAVGEFLVDDGVNSENLELHGSGETTPVADNTTKEGRAQNRRIEIRILKN